MTLIKDLIDIPERVGRDDYVLRLTEGLRDPDKTLREYVVTDQLVKCFDNALRFIRSAMDKRTSKGAYLHGSFGSGKSHFMAILHLILQGHTGARSIPELAGVIDRHNPWIEGKRFLMVPYHMLNSQNLESSLLGGYAEYVQGIHPEAEIPAVYLAEPLFADAQALRKRMGDESFFDALNEANAGDGEGWGDVEGGWNPERFDRAVSARPGDKIRLRLVTNLVRSLFKSTQEVAWATGEGFIHLDKGIDVISRHAQRLGYDGLILFLDELVLWLASRSADLKFVHNESNKLSKLVEAQSADRPVPVISFLARQRDLRYLVGKEVSGAAALNWGDILGHLDDRFDLITLEDRNLPVIAQKRILAPRDSAAEGEIGAAFEKTAQVREEVLSTLLTSDGDREIFRMVYPFSPALVQTLVAVSSMLQRERTALKVMLQLLVNQRETLKLGDVVPVGDLYNVIAHGEEPFTDEMRVHFDNAKRLYHQKLLPLLEARHGQRREALLALPADDPARRRFENEDRLMKTLLLSALAPGVEALRALTAARLAALNHGTITSPIPGREGQIVLQRVRAWAAEVGEIKVGEEVNPTLSIQLIGVDTEGIIDQARREDSEGNRIRYVRELIYRELGVKDPDSRRLEHIFNWRHTRRSCEVIYGNIRSLHDREFEPGGDGWKLIIDFPFDEAGYSYYDDLKRIEDVRAAMPSAGYRTLAWVPSFLSSTAKKDLGLLVILEHILRGERYRQYAVHLSPQDQASARAILDNRRSMLRERVKGALLAAYGVDEDPGGTVDAGHSLAEHFQSLRTGFDPQPPIETTFRGAMEGMMRQALSFERPAHPRFKADTKRSHLQKVLKVAIDAAREANGRVPVEKSLRPIIRGIADPLKLGEMAETHFVLESAWMDHFNRMAGDAEGEVTVRRMREWIDRPQPMGLPREVENLLILIYAEVTNRIVTHHNAPVNPSLADLRDEAVLREQVLPAPDRWEAAVNRAGKLFGVTTSKLLNASNVADLAGKVRSAAAARLDSCRELVVRLRKRLPEFGVESETPPRLRTALASIRLLEEIQAARSDEALISALVDATVETTETAMNRCMSGAADLVAAMDRAEWGAFCANNPDVLKIREEVGEIMRADEHAKGLKNALSRGQKKAIAVMNRIISEKKEEKDKPKSGRRENLDAAGVRSILESLADGLEAGQTIDLEWVIKPERKS